MSRPRDAGNREGWAHNTEPPWRGHSLTNCIDTHGGGDHREGMVVGVMRLEAGCEGPGVFDPVEDAFDEIAVSIGED